MSRQILESKRVGETKLYVFDFTSQLASLLITLSSPSVSVYTYSGIDGTPSNILSGSPTVSGQTVKQKIAAGNVGVTYIIAVQVSTSDGQVLQISGFLTVLPLTP